MVIKSQKTVKVASVATLIVDNSVNTLTNTMVVADHSQNVDTSDEVLTPEQKFEAACQAAKASGGKIQISPLGSYDISVRLHKFPAVVKILKGLGGRYEERIRSWILPKSNQAALADALPLLIQKLNTGNDNQLKLAQKNLLLLEAMVQAFYKAHPKDIKCQIKVGLNGDMLYLSFPKYDRQLVQEFKKDRKRAWHYVKYESGKWSVNPEKYLWLFDMTEKYYSYF